MADTKAFQGVSFGSTPNGKKSKKGVYVALFTLSIIAIIFIGIVIFQASIFVASVKDNWDELKFAYEKPAIVKAVRVDYQKKEQEVEASYKMQKQTAQEQLIQEVTNQLKGASK